MTISYLTNHSISVIKVKITKPNRLHDVAAQMIVFRVAGIYCAIIQAVRTLGNSRNAMKIFIVVYRQTIHQPYAVEAIWSTTVSIITRIIHRRVRKDVVVDRVTVLSQPTRRLSSTSPRSNNNNNNNTNNRNRRNQQKSLFDEFEDPFKESSKKPTTTTKKTTILSDGEDDIDDFLSNDYNPSSTTTKKQPHPPKTQPIRSRPNSGRHNAGRLSAAATPDIDDVEEISL